MRIVILRRSLGPDVEAKAVRHERRIVAVEASKLAVGCVPWRVRNAAIPAYPDAVIAVLVAVLEQDPRATELSVLVGALRDRDVRLFLRVVTRREVCRYVPIDAVRESGEPTEGERQGIVRVRLELRVADRARNERQRAVLACSAFRLVARIADEADLEVLLRRALLSAATNASETDGDPLPDASRSTIAAEVSHWPLPFCCQPLSTYEVAFGASSPGESKILATSVKPPDVMSQKSLVAGCPPTPPGPTR